MNKWRESLISWTSRGVHHKNKLIGALFYCLLVPWITIVISIMWLCLMVYSIPEYISHKRELKRQRIGEEENRIWEQQLIDSLRFNTIDLSEYYGTFNDVGITTSQVERSMRDLAMLQNYWLPSEIVDNSIVKYRIKKHKLK